MDQAHFLLYKSNMARAPLKPAILSYNLFGEVRDLPDVVHCETIAARSVLHDWEFAPHRHARLHQVLLIARGGPDEGMKTTASGLLRHLLLLFVPAGAGIVTQLDVLGRNLLPAMVAIVISTALGLGVTAWMMQLRKIDGSPAPGVSFAWWRWCRRLRCTTVL